MIPRIILSAHHVALVQEARSIQAWTCGKAFPSGFQWKLRLQVAAACLRAADRLDRSGSGSRVVFIFRVSTHVTVMKFTVFDHDVNLEYMHALHAACAR